MMPGGPRATRPGDAEAVTGDPIAILKGVAALPRLVALYPPGHPIVQQAVDALHELLAPLVATSPRLCVDILDGLAHLDGQPFRLESQQHAQVIQDVVSLGIESLHVLPGLERRELHALAVCFAGFRDGRSSEPIADVLAREGVTHLSVGRLLPLDTRWRARDWPDAPTGELDPDYAESLRLAEDTFGSIADGRMPGADAIRDLLQLLIYKVANSHAALGQILAVKQYENHTYCHSVNVAIIALLLGRQVGLDEPTIGRLAEGALLHDVGKTRVPIEILKKPAALDKRERAIMDRHPQYGAAMLLDVGGVGPLTPTMALEHHRHYRGGGYPDLGDREVPHPLSQIVTVADCYEAMTGARSYRDPLRPEEACLILARLSGSRLSPALVKAFVGAVTFFPIGSLVRTNTGIVGVVVRTQEADPLHPVIALVDDQDPARPAAREIDTSLRDDSGAYVCDVVATLLPPAPSRAA